MNNKLFLGKRFILIITIVAVFFFLLNVCFMAVTIRNSYSDKIISVLGAVSESYGDIDKEVIDNVLNEKYGTYQKGISILKKNGYGLSGEKIIRNFIWKEISFISIFMLVILIFVILCLYIMFHNHLKFLNKLERYMDEFNNADIYDKENSIYTKAVVEKLRNLSLNSGHNNSLLQKEKEKIHKFMEDLSHQMKTPLAVAHLYIERFLYENSNLETNKLELGLLQLEKMVVLINSFLKISMLESSNIKLEIKNNNIYHFIEDSVEDVRPLFENNNINITIQGDTLAFFQFDDFWMKEAIVNLLKNSIEHSPRETEITIEFQKKNHDMVLRVIDSGKGIEKNKLPFIFDRFTSSIRQKDGSNGLGLSIAKHVVMRHFGQINVKNNMKCGVTFEIRLPALRGKEVYNPYNDVR